MTLENRHANGCSEFFVHSSFREQWPERDRVFEQLVHLLNIPGNQDCEIQARDPKTAVFGLVACKSVSFPW